MSPFVQVHTNSHFIVHNTGNGTINKNYMQSKIISFFKKNYRNESNILLHCDPIEWFKLLQGPSEN